MQSLAWQPNRNSRRDRYWPAVLKIIGAFSSRHLQQALLLFHNVSLQVADDGQPQHLLTRRHDLPLLDLHFWLFDDWSIPDAPEREARQKALFVATTFAFLALTTKSSRLDPHSFFDNSYRSLEDELWRHADLHWNCLFPDASPFWERYRHARESAFSAIDSNDPFAARGHWALASLPAIAAALLAGKETSISQLVSFCDQCRVALQIIDNLATFRRDLTNGIVTYPIKRALAAMRLADTSNPSVDTALCALLLTGTLDKVLKENEVRVAAAWSVAAALNLPTLQAYCSELDRLMQQVRAMFGLKLEKSLGEVISMPGFFVPAPDVLGNVMLKAEAYLLADPSFREAWDVQEHSYASAQRIIGRSFAASLIIDILCQHGHQMPAAVDDVLETLQSNGFRYWNHVDLIVPDADDLALGMRLIPHASRPELRRAAFEVPLRWMRESQMPSGQIPVWFRNHDSPPALSDIAVLYGANCATVETNLMIALIDSDWEGYRDVIEACARHWCQRWLAVGLAACEHYTPLYSLWAGMELVTLLSARSVDEVLGEQVELVATRLRNRLAREAEREDLSPQDAAFLILASLRSRALPFDATWVVTLFKNQRPDGCWEGEPIYIVPTARNLTTTWFKSRTVTTAFAYHALKHHHAHLQSE